MMNNKQTDWFVDFDLGMILICFESETEEKNRRRKLQLNHFCCCLPIVCRLFLSVCHKMFSSNIAIVIDHLLHQRNRIQHTHPCIHRHRPAMAAVSFHFLGQPESNYRYGMPRMSMSKRRAKCDRWLRDRQSLISTMENCVEKSALIKIINYN